MASVRREVPVGVDADRAWDAISDFGAVAARLGGGFVVESKLEGEGVRVVTYANGAVAREVLIDADDDERRLAYSIVESPVSFAHCGCSMQVVEDDAGRRVVWIVDVLPHEVGPVAAALMDQGAEALRKALAAPG